MSGEKHGSPFWEPMRMQHQVVHILIYLISNQNLKCVRPCGSSTHKSSYIWKTATHLHMQCDRKFQHTWFHLSGPRGLFMQTSGFGLLDPHLNLLWDFLWKLSRQFSPMVPLPEIVLSICTHGCCNFLQPIYLHRWSRTTTRIRDWIQLESWWWWIYFESWWWWIHFESWKRWIYFEYNSWNESTLTLGWSLSVVHKVSNGQDDILPQVSIL